MADTLEVQTVDGVKRYFRRQLARVEITHDEYLRLLGIKKQMPPAVVARNIRRQEEQERQDATNRALLPDMKLWALVHGAVRRLPGVVLDESCREPYDLGDSSLILTDRDTRGPKLVLFACYAQYSHQSSYDGDHVGKIRMPEIVEQVLYRGCTEGWSSGTVMVCKHENAWLWTIMPTYPGVSDMDEIGLCYRATSWDELEQALPGKLAAFRSQYARDRHRYFQRESRDACDLY